MAVSKTVGVVSANEGRYRAPPPDWVNILPIAVLAALPLAVGVMMATMPAHQDGLASTPRPSPVVAARKQR